MIIIEFMGGLGNQLYQYALYQKLKFLDKEVKMDISRFTDSKVGRKDKRNLDINKFGGVKYETCSLKERARFIDDNQSIIAKARRKFFGKKDNRYRETKLFDENIFQLENAYLSGFFQYYEYFSDILPQLRKTIIFPETIGFQNIETEKIIREKNSVSLHIRRGDYLDGKNQELFGGICTNEYYEAAIDEIEKRVKNPFFLIFSDEPEYINTFAADKKNVIVVDWNTNKETSIYDMKLMSMCKHNICANSTFSIWAAMLNKNKNAVRIKSMRATNMESENDIKIKSREAGWCFIDRDGTVEKTASKND